VKPKGAFDTAAATRPAAAPRAAPEPLGPTARRPRRGRRGRLAAARVPLLALVAALLIPLFLDGYFAYLANLALVYVIVAIGFTIILGWAGQMAFADVAFFGLGAYTGARAASLWGVPAELALAIGILAGLVVGLGFGALVVRLRRYYLSIVTIAFMFVLDYLYRHLDPITGGVRGFAVPSPHFLLLGGQKISSPHLQYYVGLVLVVLAYLFAVRLRKSALGRGWQVVRVDERAAQALGIDVYRSKLAAFAISAAVIAPAGVWLGYLSGRVFPESFGMNELLFHFLIVVIGGLGSLNGAVLGAVLLVLAREYLRGFVGVSEILFGLLLLVSVLVLQKGIYGTLADRFKRLREGFV
jgi:branched-chain amino acid transport system permease protein